MKTTRILTCIFSAEEMKKLGIELAVANQHKESLEDSKKQAMSQYKAEIDAADATIKSLSQKLARGSEERKVECDVLFNTPEEGKKKIVRSDTGEEIDVLLMTENEMQDLFINNLGAQKDAAEFVFRDKSRAKMISFEDFKKISEKGEFVKIGDGYTEKALVDAKPEDLNFVVVVYDFDNDTKQDSFEVYKFTKATEAPAEPEPGEPKLLPGAEVIDAEEVTAENMDNAGDNWNPNDTSSGEPENE